MLKIPNIGEFERHIGTLVKIDTIQPPIKPIKEYIFEECIARCEIRYNGEVLNTFETLNDFYGLGTSVKKAIEDATNYCTNRNITPKSDVEVVVIKVISQFRAKPLNRENFYSKEYYDFSPLDFDSKRDLPNDIETIVWSSKTDRKSSPEINRSALNKE